MVSLLFVIALSLVGPCFCAPLKSKSPVFKLTNSDFDHFLKDKDVMLVDFYAPWCSDCAKLKPNFDAAAEDFARKGKFVFAKIDCFGGGRSICENRFNVHSWPQLKVFRRGQYAGEYSGYQDRDSLERFMDSILKQKVPDNIGQDQAAAEQQPGYTQNVNGPWYQNGWQFNRVGMQPYGQTPPGWKRG